MKVKNLIEKLQNFDKEKEVFVWFSGLVEVEEVAENQTEFTLNEDNGSPILYLKEI